MLPISCHFTCILATFSQKIINFPVVKSFFKINSYFVKSSLQSQNIEINLGSNGDPIKKMKPHIPITLSWENIVVHTPSSKESLMEKLMFFKKEKPSKEIIKNGIKKTITSITRLTILI